MRTKILAGLLALIISCFLWFIHDGLKTDVVGKNDNLNKKTGDTKEVLSKTTLSFSNPLEMTYNRLELAMDRESALAIVEEEYPLKDNEKYFSVGHNYDGTYVWRWQWENKTDSGAIESATLVIVFTKEGDCVMCRIANAVYEYKFDTMTIQKDLQDDYPKI